MTTSNHPPDPMTAIIAETRNLDAAWTRWTDLEDRRAVPEATSAIDFLIVALHRLRDHITDQARRYDHDHRPHDPRD